MDSEGYVELSEIMKFRRIANLHLRASFVRNKLFINHISIIIVKVYESLRYSSQLDILVTEEASTMLQEDKQTDLDSNFVEDLISKTRIRAAN